MKKTTEKCLAFRSYTLIEVLTVITILIILASMLFPAMGRIRESARRMNCVNKAKDQAQAMVDFTQRNGGRVPFARGGFGAIGGLKTVFNWQGETYSLNSLDWDLLICANGMGMPLDYLNAGEQYKNPDFAWGWEVKGDNVLPGDNWEMTYNPEQYSDGGSGNAEKEDEKDSLPPGYMGTDRSSPLESPGYYYQTHNIVFWRCFCDNTLPSPYIAKNFNMLYPAFQNSKQKEHDSWPLDEVIITKSGTYQANLNFGVEKDATEKCAVQVLVTTAAAGTTSTGTAKAKKMQSIPRMMMNISQIPTPSKRCFTAEMGESSVDQEDDSLGMLRFPVRGTPLTTWRNAMPGYGAAGQGKENYEIIGNDYDPGAITDIDPESFKDMQDEQIKQGRHAGYVIHTFFDGHVESLTAEAVGRRQLPIGAKPEKDLKGPYGNVLEAAEDGE